MSKSITTNYLFSLINTVSSVLFPLITFPYVTRILYADGIGLVQFYSSVITYITLIVSVGIPSYAVRQIARVRDNQEDLNKQTIEILLLHLYLTAIGYLLVFLISLTVGRIQENLPLFFLLSTNIFFVTIGCEWFYQGIEDFKYITIRAIIVRTVCVVLLFMLVHDREDILYYGFYSVFGVVGGNVFNFIRLRKYVSLSRVKLKSLNPWRHFLPAIKIFGLILISSVYLNLDIVMLGFLSDNSSVGYYIGAEKLTKLLMGVVTAVGAVILPRLSNIAANDGMEEFKKIVNKSIQFVIAISLPLIVGLIVMSPILIQFFCGEGYYPSISCLIILSPIVFLISVSYIINQSFYPLNMMRELYIKAAISAGVNFFLNLLLIPAYKQDGAAIGTFVAELLSTVVSVYLFRNVIRIHFLTYRNILYLSSALLMGVVLISFKMMSLPNIINVFLLPVIGMIVYSSILFYSKDEFSKELFVKFKAIINVKK